MAPGDVKYFPKDPDADSDSKTRACCDVNEITHVNRLSYCVISRSNIINTKHLSIKSNFFLESKCTRSLVKSTVLKQNFSRILGYLCEPLKEDISIYLLH
jgi:hypothetical protein